MHDCVNNFKSQINGYIFENNSNLCSFDKIIFILFIILIPFMLHINNKVEEHNFYKEKNSELIKKCVWEAKTKSMSFKFNTADIWKRQNWMEQNIENGYVQKMIMHNGYG